MSARKIPRLQMGAGPALLIALAASPADAQVTDTVALFREARRAEIAYESSVRRFAPTSYRPAHGRTCDEVVGRFCLFFDDGKDSLPPEPADVDAARDTAIARLRRAFAAAPERTAAVFPLVRFLDTDGRALDAESLARAHARVARDTASAYMLLGYAMHHARNTAAAAAAFESWLAMLEPDERRHIIDLDWLLDRRRAGQYRRLEEAERALFEQRVWRYADPLYLTPGNELLTDHLARHALSRMLAARPSIPNVEGWGEDIEQLTVRFGAPTVTTRSWRTGSTGALYDYSEHWDPSQRVYLPPDVDAAVATAASLDTIWPLEQMATRSGHAPPTIRTMRVLEHQAAVFGGSAPTLLVTGRVQLDTLARPEAMVGRIFLLDSLVNVIADAPASILVAGDSVAVHAEMALPAEARFYSAEVYDSDSRFAARARHRIDNPARAATLTLSSILLAAPFDPGRLPQRLGSELLRPLTRPVITSGSMVGIYTEVSSAAAEPRALHVELENRQLDGKSALARAVGWIGKKLGLASPTTPSRLGWNVDIQPRTANALPVTLDLSSLAPGRYVISITVTDPADEAHVVASREILVVSAGRSSRSDRP